jgi:hypothetical protein
VVLTDTVPNDTTFNAGASSPGWTCVPNGNPGGVCTNPVGNVGASGSKVFAVTIGSGLPFGTGTITNTASIGDDNANGADLNPADNTDTDTTNVFVPTPTPTSTNTPAVTNTPTSTNTPTNTPTATMTPTPGTNGCRPGYWKDHQNNWPAPYTPSTTLGSVFTLPACGGINTLAGDTFSQALDYGGGPTIKDAAQQLLRQAVAALLNAASGIGYPLHQAQIINEVNTALASCNRDTIQAEAQRLEDFNRSHCPLP